MGKAGIAAKKRKFGSKKKEKKTAILQFLLKIGEF
jgi:hypothetical protein